MKDREQDQQANRERKQDIAKNDREQDEQTNRIQDRQANRQTTGKKS